MTGVDIRLLLLAGFGSFGCFLGGIRLLKRKKDVSAFHMAINLFLGAGLFTIFLVACLVFYLTEALGYQLVNKNIFYLLGTIWLGAGLFVSGLYGILKKKEIRDVAFFRLSVTQLLGSIMTAIFVIAMIVSGRV
ncbi:MAG: hypothetical protein HGB35_00775 [Geobacteraceae bacterium]|nr:hypothetical protein [Geobacteraceae bacterium]